MRPSTLRVISHTRANSTGTGNVATSTPPAGCSGAYICAETTNARVTFDNSDPSAGSAPSLVIPQGAAPIYVPLGSDAVVKHCSTAAAPSVLQILWLA